MILLLTAAPALGSLLTLLIYIVVFLIVAGLIFWAINSLSAAFGIPEPIKTVLIVGLVIVVVVALIYILLGGLPLH